MRKTFMLLAFLSFLLIGCNKSITLAEPSGIEYDGEYITWTEVEDCDYYSISVNASEYYSVNVNRYLFDSTQSDFTVSIQAKSRDDNNEESGVVEKNFTFIGEVDNINIVDNKLVWDNKAEANSYKIRVNGQYVATVAINEYDGLPTGINSVEVLAINTDNDSSYSGWSEQFSYKLLEIPENIAYDSMFITWDSVSYASSYVVELNNVEYPVSSGTRLEFLSEDIQTLNVRVKAIGDIEENEFDSNFSEEISYIYLDPITELNVEDGILTWDSIEHATSYDIEITTPTGTINTSSENNSYNGLIANTQYNIRVFAETSEATHFFSSWSESINVRILPAPVLSYENESFIWDGVSSSDGYIAEIYLEDAKVDSQITSVSGSYGIVYDFPTEGTYTVSVKSVSSEENNGIYDSQFSESYTVIRLASPSNVTFSHDEDSSEAALVNFDEVPFASSYSIYLDDVEVTNTYSTTNSLAETSDETLVEKSWSYSFQSHGLVNESRKEVVLESSVSESYVVKKLAVPTNTNVSDNVYSWFQTNDNSGYIIEIDGMPFLNSVNDIDYLISNVTPGAHNLKVRAVGNGSDIISSDYSFETQVTKLPEPQISVSNGYITWNKIDNSSGYQYSVNAVTGSFNIDVLAYEIQNSDLVNQRAVFNIYAKGDGGNILDSDASETDSLLKLDAPNIHVTDDFVQWELVDNALSYDFLIGDVVYRNGITATSFSTSDLPADTYVFSVIAYGNSSNTINSIESNELQITKLETPQVRVENNIYVWNAVSGAESYNVTILGNTYNITSIEFNPYDYFDIARTYSVDVQAINQGVSYIDSNEFSFNQEVRNLSFPTFTYSNNDGVVTIEITDTSSNATGYYYYVNGNEVASETNTYSFNANLGEYILQTAVKGGLFIDNIYYKDSVKSVSETIEFLTNPSGIQLVQVNLSIEIYEIEWDNIQNATYEYEIYNAGNLVYSGSSNENSIQNIDLTGYNSVTVKVKAIGNQSSTFDSDWSSEDFNLN